MNYWVFKEKQPEPQQTNANQNNVNLNDVDFLDSNINFQYVHETLSELPDVNISSTISTSAQSTSTLTPSASTSAFNN